MDLFSRLNEKSEVIKNNLESNLKAELPDLATTPGLVMGGIPADRKASDFLKASVGWVYACAGVIADEIAGIKIRLYSKKGQDVKEIESHPALELLHKANDFTTKFDLFWMTAQYLELTGEAPWFLALNGSGIPDQILLLRPDSIDIKPGTGGKIIDHYEYTLSGKKVRLEPEEVVFLRYPDPDRQFRGKGPLQAAARAVDLEEYSEEYNRRFFWNSARPDGVLSTENKLGKEQLETLERKFNQKYKGSENAHKTVILEKGLKWQNMGLSQKDMDFIEQARFSRDKILGIFRVPRTVLGITDDVNRANAEATDYVFASRTIRPKMERIIQQLNEFLLPKFKGTESMFFDFDNPVPEDKVFSLEMQKAALTLGWLTINEVREMDGYDPVGDDGDVLRVPLSNAPLGEEAFMDDPEEKEINIDRSRSVNIRSRGVNKQAEMKGKIINELSKQIKAQFFTGKVKGKKKVKHTEFKDNPLHLEFQTKQHNVATSYEKRVKAKMSSVFRAQKEKVLSKMGTKALKAGVDWSKFLLLPKEEKRRYAREMASEFSSLIIAQAQEAFTFVGVDQKFDKGSPAVKKYLENRAFRFSQPVTRVTNRLLGRAFSEGIAEGESIPQLRKRVEDVFGKMDKYRSERIARSETIRASNYAAESAYEESGVVQSKQWLTALDERTCEWCAPMNQRTLGLGDSYFKKGEAFTGAQGGVIKLDFETVGAPPLHPNCRCTLIPVVLEKPSGEGWRPKMSQDQAEQFVSESDIKETLYHGTIEAAADSIGDNGFSVSSTGGTGGEIVKGVYLTTQKEAATDYAFAATGSAGTGARPAVLPVKIDVKNVKIYSWHGLYDELAKKLGVPFTSAQAREELLSQGLEAIQVNDELNNQTYLAVLDPKKIVLIDQPDYSPLK